MYCFILFYMYMYMYQIHFNKQLTKIIMKLLEYNAIEKLLKKTHS